MIKLIMVNCDAVCTKLSAVCCIIFNHSLQLDYRPASFELQKTDTAGFAVNLIKCQELEVGVCFKCCQALLNVCRDVSQYS